MSINKKTVLIDLSGTIHIEDSEIPGSISALQRLRTCNVNIRFVTNTTKESKRILFNRLKQIGFEIESDEIFTSLTAAVQLLRERKSRPLLLVDEKAMEDFEGIPVSEPNCVVVGLAPEKFDYTHMNEAFQLLVKGAPLIAIHTAKYYKRTDGLALGPGPFVMGLESSSGTVAEIVGKPSPNFFLSAIKEFGSNPTDCFMIGDDVWGDIEGAESLGMKGFLVKTGKYRHGDELKIPKQPEVVDSFASAIDTIVKELA